MNNARPKQRTPLRKPVVVASKKPDMDVHPVLAVILGDQLDIDARLLRELDPARDTILMMEVAQESEHVPSHVQRTVLFLSAMRHFASELTRRGFNVRYVKLDDANNTHTFSGEISRAVKLAKPARISITQPGEHRVRAMIAGLNDEFSIPVEIQEDEHFLTPPATFAAWAKGRMSLTMEYFYREQRRRLNILMDGDKPVSGTWNYDHDNRVSFGKTGPNARPHRPCTFKPDAITRDVIKIVAERFPRAPGRVEPAGETFGWPVTRADALVALQDFIVHRLPLFGPYEDAMWTDEPFVYHSVLSPMLNMKLISPRECVAAALDAFEKGNAPLQSVEAFIRQIIGWREFIRGIYDLEGPTYAERNSMRQFGKLPDLYWTGKTDMACMNACIGQVVDRAYGHHIQRLMVTGNFALMAGVHPREISDWYLAMYADGVDWVTLPNTLGMVMHADGTGKRTSVVGTKPYAASGAYIGRMSNYCTKCRYEPAKRHGESACPFTVFYWDFLRRHRARFEKNPRMGQIIKNLDRFGEETVTQITISATKIRLKLGIGDIDTPRGPKTDHSRDDYSTKLVPATQLPSLRHLPSTLNDTLSYTLSDTLFDATKQEAARRIAVPKKATAKRPKPR